jgi:hypothetical protein
MLNRNFGWTATFLISKNLLVTLFLSVLAVDPWNEVDVFRVSLLTVQSEEPQCAIRKIITKHKNIQINVYLRCN